MTHFSIALVLVSAFMHAAWNLLARRRRSEAIFFHRMLLIVVLIGFVPAAVVEGLTGRLGFGVLLCGFSSGLLCGFYFFFLARAYHSADFTTVYPVARALPVLLVALGDMAWGRFPTAAGWLGILLVFFGCLLAPLESFRHIRGRSYFNRATLWMLLTALGTVGYTLLDKLAADMVAQGPLSAARYEYIFFVGALVAYELLWRRFLKGEIQPHQVGWGGPLAAGGLNFGAYCLVLWAYQLSSNASYVVAFRQFSIVIGVVFAFILFAERGVRVRLTGTLMILAGLVLITLYGS